MILQHGTLGNNNNNSNNNNSNNNNSNKNNNNNNKLFLSLNDPSNFIISKDILGT